MTSFEKLTLLLSAVQGLAIVGSLAALWWQFRQFNQNMRYDALCKHVDAASAVSELLLTHPDLNAPYYSKQPSVRGLTLQDQQFYNFIAYVLGLYERLYIISVRHRWVEMEFWHSWEDWLRWQWFPLDLFDTYWRNEKSIYAPDFRSRVDTLYEEYKAQTLPSPPNTPIQPTGSAGG